MTATYTLVTLSSVPKDQVRLLIGDTDMGSPMLQDEEIVYLLGTFKSTYGVAANCCRTLAGRFARLADHAQGDLRTSHSQKAKAFLTLAAQYTNLAKSAGAPAPYSGGISILDKQTNQQDTDYNQPPFAVGQDDNNTMPIAADDTPATLVP